MSKIELLPHNQKLYNEIKENIDNGELSIFYSEATGLGKSFIFMKLIEEYFVGKKVLYIVPKIAIWENLAHYEEFNELDAEIEMKTFTAFNKYDSNNEMLKIYDAVFVDECHHMLSDIQGKNVGKFLSDINAVGKKTFGFTATPKYGDSYVDEVYFKVSCYGYDVFEAIKLGLFPKIDIAIADIDFTNIPIDVQKKFSVVGTKSILEQIIEERSDITHWVAYYGNKDDLEQSEKEVRKLFPDFVVIKLYMGCGSPRDVINYFEKYNGKIILMSVSMLLEGMHLNNVGGVLLYRNVVKASTYFQIYGRLCKMGVKRSPLLLDITNSILNVDDYNMFKSSKSHRSMLVYNRRDLFDITSKSYRYVELHDVMDVFREKVYRGVKWTTNRSLFRALGLKGDRSFHKDYYGQKVYEDYIDSRLKDSTYEEYLNNGYVGYYYCDGYKYRNYSDLLEQLGVSCDYNSYSKKHNNATVSEYIKWAKGVVNNRVTVIYRGVDITTSATIAKHFGNSASNVLWSCGEHGWTYEQYVDDRLNGSGRYHSRQKVELYRGVNIALYKNIADHFGIHRSSVSNYIKNKGLSKEEYVDLRIDHPEVFRTNVNKSDSEVPSRQKEEIWSGIGSEYRGVDTGSYESIASYFGANASSVKTYVISRRITIKDYIDARLDNPERFGKNNNHVKTFNNNN